MAFKKKRNHRRGADTRPAATSAEICETRALLSAAAVCLPADCVDAPVEETVNEESAELVDGESVDLTGMECELAICTMFFVDPAAEGDDVFIDENGDGELMELTGFEDSVETSEFIEEDFVLYDESTEDWDPSWAYRTFIVGDGTSEELVDPVDGWVDDSESWIYESGFVVDDQGNAVYKEDQTYGEDFIVLDDQVESVDDGFVDDGFVDVTTLEDWDPSWAYRCFSVGGADGEQTVEESMVDGEVTVQHFGGISKGLDDKVVSIDDQVDSVDLESSDDVVDVTTLEGWDPSWAYRGVVVEDGKPTDETDAGVVGPVVSDDSIEVVETEVVDSGSALVDDNGDLISADVIFYSFSTGFEPLAELDSPPLTTATIGFPVSGSGTSLFTDGGPDLFSVGTLVQSDLGDVVETTPVTEESSEISDSLTSDGLASNDGLSGELNVLSPLFESDDRDSGPVSKPAESNIEFDEVSAQASSDYREISVARSEQPASQRNVPVVSNAYQRTADIDLFMSDFAVNSFMS